jgi:predicted phage replisome organizer/uncharacterized phage protein (TIGR02220 family)
MVKKYFWLKLHKDFFKRHDVKVIEDMDNGKDYVLFYLKLLVESLSHEGHLRFSDTVPYNDKMLSSITNTNIDIVRSAIKLFTELNMMEILDDGTIYLNEVNNMIGSETDWAKKKRIYREKQKAIETSEGQKKTMSDKSKSKSKSKKKINTFVEENEEKDEKETIPYKEIIDYLNLKTKKSYRHTTKSTRKLIRARWNEGFRKDDFFKCIDNAYSFRMLQGGDLTYLRPSTLFNGSFENRVNGDGYEKMQSGKSDVSIDEF